MMRDALYTGDRVLLSNTPDQAESRLHSLEEVNNDIGLN